MDIKFDTEDLEGGQYLGEGEHECTISAIENKLTKAKQEPMLEMTFTSVSGKSTRDWFMLVGKKFKLAQLALATGSSKEQLLAGSFNPMMLRGRKVKVLRKITGTEMYGTPPKPTNKYENDYLPSGQQQTAASSEEIPF